MERQDESIPIEFVHGITRVPGPVVSSIHPVLPAHPDGNDMFPEVNVTLWKNEPMAPMSRWMHSTHDGARHTNPPPLAGRPAAVSPL